MNRNSALDLALEFLKQQNELGVDTLPIHFAGPDRHGSPEGEFDDDLESLRAKAINCQACSLCEGRSSVVFGEGNPRADIMFVGEAPGAEEDRQGVPFVGASGQLLTRMVEAMGVAREDVYIANVVNCRPPNNRDPLPEEIEKCEPYLIRQIEMVAPVVICTLGRFAAQTLLKTTDSMGRLRGKIFDYHGVKLVPTYHPAALLRNAQWKRPTWEDLKLVRTLYDGTKL
ncbi:MAG: uracil-DNA glycosylase [Candidatus Latescibacteria bacterium]|nr:uracil-DNA glycosylase [Candidatus Latescibacterota bacterium]MBT4136508.1 uracil-DNA glycosylase [Candidatus Latescibacterota bacterium]